MIPEDFYSLCRFFCPNGCGRSYKRKNGLMQHVKFECGILPKFKCMRCEKTFARKSTIQSHMVNVHKLIE